MTFFYVKGKIIDTLEYLITVLKAKSKGVISFTCWAFKLILKVLNWSFTISSTTSNCPSLRTIWNRVFHYVRLIDPVRLLVALEYSFLILFQKLHATNTITLKYDALLAMFRVFYFPEIPFGLPIKTVKNSSGKTLDWKTRSIPSSSRSNNRIPVTRNWNFLLHWTPISPALEDTEKMRNTLKRWPVFTIALPVSWITEKNLFASFVIFLSFVMELCISQCSSPCT